MSCSAPLYRGIITMPTFKDATMHLLETTIDKYGTAGDTTACFCRAARRGGLNSAEAVTEPDHELLGAALSRNNTMPTFKDATMHLLETTIDKYGTAGDTCTESAIRDLLT